MRFAEAVWDVTKRIPRGKVATYGQIAHALGTQAYRAVGQALHRNPYAPVVPCHRVVASDGTLGGFAHGKRRKAALLRREGISITHGRIDLATYGVSLRAFRQRAARTHHRS